MPLAEQIATDCRYSLRVNPQWVKLLNVLELSVSYERCTGTELFTADGRRILDFLSGYCVHNVGHNHPVVLSAVMEQVQKRGAVMYCRPGESVEWRPDSGQRHFNVRCRLRLGVQLNEKGHRSHIHVQ